MAEAGAYQLLGETTEGSTLRMAVRGRIETANAQRLLNDINARLSGTTRELVLDLSAVEYFDSGGGAVLIALRQRLARAGGSLRITSSTPAIDGFLSLVDQDALLAPPLPPTHPPVGLTTQLGEATIELWYDFRELVSFTGDSSSGCATPCSIRGACAGARPGSTWSVPASTRCRSSR